MGRYNLLDEKWVAVICQDGGQTELVSLKELFANAQHYYDLAGEMKTQDFAVMRVLLAVLHTVFSRFDAEGEPYDLLEIDEERFQQEEPVSEEDLEKYEDMLFDTWMDLWEERRFPEIVQEYLERWRDHFYLFDDRYPFYQVTAEEMEELAAGGGQFFGKNINRTVSESNNKVALFAPTADIKREKDRLSYDQLARWLITFQGYTGTGDKKKVTGTGDKKKVRETELTCSKGWLFDLGGVYLQGKNLFETLLLNCKLSVTHDKDDEGRQELRAIQIPSWERSSIENVDVYFKNQVTNLATLYSSWSRAVSFDQNFQEGEAFSCYIAKLPEINHVNNFLEPMTCWMQANSGLNKGAFLPKKHRPEEAMWRNFSILMGLEQEGEKSWRPGILRWYAKISEELKEISHYRITICGVSMRDDGNATSWSPTDEIVDTINLETAVAVDTGSDGWLVVINHLINETRHKMDRTLGGFLRNISTIRGYDKKDNQLVNRGREELYQRIDVSFRDWLGKISVSDSTNEKSNEWYSVLETSLIDYGSEIFEHATERDFKGVSKKDTSLEQRKGMNIATAYNVFRRRVYKEFHREG